jgi:competence protein ComEC
VVELPESRLTSFPLFILALTIASGILLEHWARLVAKPAYLVTLTLGPLFLLGIGLMVGRKVSPSLLLLLTGFLLTGLALGKIGNRPVSQDQLMRMLEEGLIASDEPVELTGVVQNEPELAPDGFYLKLRVELIRVGQTEQNVSGDVLLLAQVANHQLQEEYQALELRHGARIRLLTTLEREEQFRNPGVSPFTEYLERQNLAATAVIKSPLLIERLEDEPVFVPLAWLYEWRGRLGQEFAGRFSRETAGVLQAALLGNPHNISDSAAERFRAGGTFHVLVISGLQISFIAALVFWIFRRLLRNKIVQVVLAAIFLWAYTIAVGAEASVTRSAIMFTLVILAPLFHRPVNSLNTIGGAALGLMALSPNDLFNPSFQLTFLSVLSIVVAAVPLLDRLKQIGSWRPTRLTPFPPDCGPRVLFISELLFWSEQKWRAEMAVSNVKYRLFKTPLVGRLERWHLQRPLRIAFATVVVSACVQIGMLPLLVIYFHRISIAALLLNIFVGALMAALSLVALAAILFAPVSLWLSAILVALAEKIDYLMIHVVDPFTRWGIDSIRIPHYSGWQGIAYAVYFLPLGFLVVGLAHWKPLRPVAIVKSEVGVLSRRNLRIAGLASVAAIVLILAHPFSAARPDGNFHLEFLDVGQGDAALLTMPDGSTLLVDGGGRPTFNRPNEDADSTEAFQRDTRSIGESVVAEFLWARGLDRVDYILATHADADHIDGLNAVARNFRVRAAIVARTPQDDPEYRHFARTMNDVSVPVVQIGAGDELRFGNLEVQVLWPLPTNDSRAPSRNNDSIMLLLKYGEQRFLLTGDIEKEGESAVLRTGLDLHCDALKVAHHGSRTSSTQAFIDATRPGLAIISVGRHSRFGHPNAEVVERWRESGSKVMTTGQRGTISLTSDGRELTLSTFVK